MKGMRISNKYLVSWIDKRDHLFFVELETVNVFQNKRHN